MFTLENFYQSREWRKLVNTLKLERVKDGQLICEYCGMPIVKSYDCIGHHITELTEENVNDYLISLNPENIMLIHFKCHNRIHERFEGFTQRVYLVYGSPCSGKTTWVNEQASDDDLIVDIDRLWEAICKSDRYHKPAKLKKVVFRMRDDLIDQIKHRNGFWKNAYVIGGYPMSTERRRICELLGAVPIFIDTPEAECMERAPTEEWKGYIADWWEDYTE